MRAEFQYAVLKIESDLRAVLPELSNAQAQRLGTALGGAPRGIGDGFLPDVRTLLSQRQLPQLKRWRFKTTVIVTAGGIIVVPTALTITVTVGLGGFMMKDIPGSGLNPSADREAVRQLFNNNGIQHTTQGGFVVPVGDHGY